MIKTALMETVDQRPQAVETAIASLARNRILVRERDRIRYADDVPPEYLELVRKIASTLSGEARYRRVAKRKKMAFERANDHAPRLFESALRHRNIRFSHSAPSRQEIAGEPAQYDGCSINAGISCAASPTANTVSSSRKRHRRSR